MRIVSLLAALGRRGRGALAVFVVIGVAIPPLGHLLRPYLAVAVFLLLTLAFLRVDLAAVRQHVRRPMLILAATLWTALGVPILLFAASNLAGLSRSDPGLYTGLMLQGLASPLMASPAVAALIGLDATLVLVTLVTGTLVAPFVAPVLAHLMLGGTLAISSVALGSRLGLTLGGSMLAASILRRLVGTPTIERNADAIGGVNVVILLVFVAAVMGDVADMAVADPVAFAGIMALAFGVAAVLLLASTLLFRRSGRIEALSLGLMASQRNMGLLFAAIGGGLPKTAWLYFALCQFPIYLSPLLLPPLVRALGRRA